MQENLEEVIMKIHIPRWNELPEIDLYLDQVVNYLEKYLTQYSANKEDKIITKTMINNYVKQGIMPAPEKKKYSRAHIAYLMVICVLKQVYSISDIGKLIEKIAYENGYSVVEEYCGHGVGLKMHEDPYVLHYDAHMDGVLIVPGMVFTIEPMINEGKKGIRFKPGDTWSSYTIDGKLSAQWEHTLLVTEDGVEILSF